MSEPRRTALSVLLPGFTGTTLPRWLRERLDEGLAGACLFGHNVTGPEQVRALTDAVHGVRRGVLVASDEEGGTVTRLEDRTGSSWPGHATLGALDDVTATRAVAEGLGGQARSAGVDLVLAPVVDVNSDPENPVIGVRSFGDAPGLVARHGAAFVQGLQSSGVAACAKHFPGHGSTRTDSHLALPVVDAPADVLRARDIPPFAAVVEAGVRCVMTAHVVVRELDDRPATMSPPVLRLLRKELGFDGVVVSDALDMRAVARGVGRAEGAVQALAAGVDLLCVGNPIFPDPYDEQAAVEELVAAITGAVSDGRLPMERLEEASRRVAGLAAWAAAAPATPPDHAGDALALGSQVARRALRVRGDVRVAGDAVVVVPGTEVGFAAGRRESALVSELRQRRPGWEVAEPTGAAAVNGLLGAAPDREVVVVVGGRQGPGTREVVAAVLRDRPDAVVVYGGLPEPADAGSRAVHAFGGGRATARAVADLVVGVAR